MLLHYQTYHGNVVGLHGPPFLPVTHVCWLVPTSCQAEAGAGGPARAFRLKSITGSSELYLEGSPADRRAPKVSAGRQRVEQAGRNVQSATNRYGLFLRLRKADGTEW